MSTSRKITLKSTDRQAFEVDEAVALELQAIKPMMEDGRADNGIILGLSGETISNVIKYCKKHVESPKSDDCATGAVDDDLKAWDAEFVNVDRDTLFDLVIIESLLELTCETVLDLTEDKTREELLKWFYFKVRPEMGVEMDHLIKVNDVFGIIQRYLLKGYYSWTKKQLIAETIMSLLPSHSGMKDPQETMAYPWSRKKDPHETLPENPGAASHTSRKITLQSSDREAFEVDEAVALESLRIKYYINCNCADDIIPLPKVTSKILSKVIEYCKKHVESRKSDDCATGAINDDLKAWDTEFVKVDQATLFNLIHAAHYFDIESLSKLTCKTFLDMNRGKTQEEFKRAFELLMHTEC